MTLVQKSLITLSGGICVGLLAITVFVAIADFDQTAPVGQQIEANQPAVRADPERPGHSVSHGTALSKNAATENTTLAIPTRTPGYSSQQNKVAADFSADVAEDQPRQPVDNAAEAGAGSSDPEAQAATTIKATLAQYELTNDPAKKRELRTVLASSNEAEIEQYALSKLVSEIDPAVVKDWLALLAQKGILATNTRQTVLKMIPSLTDPQDQRYAITAMEPAVVSTDHRAEVVRELASHSYSGSDEVRSAAIEMIGRWGDPSYAHLIENALFDTAPRVRSAALFAAYTSTVRTEEIKRSLMRIMDSGDESWDFRMDAYSALSAYQLTAEEHEKLYQFDQDKQVLVDPKRNNKG